MQLFVSEHSFWKGPSIITRQIAVIWMLYKIHPPINTLQKRSAPPNAIFIWHLGCTSEWIESIFYHCCFLKLSLLICTMFNFFKNLREWYMCIKVILLTLFTVVLIIKASLLIVLVSFYNRINPHLITSSIINTQAFPYLQGLMRQKS